MVKNSKPGSLYQSRYPVSTAHASRSGFGAGSQSPYALNETPSHNGRNVPIQGGPPGKARNLHDNPAALDAPESHGASEKAVVQSPAPSSSPAANVHGETPTPIE